MQIKSFTAIKVDVHKNLQSTKSISGVKKQEQ